MTLFLYNIGELSSYEEVIKNQSKNDLLFGPALSYDVLTYKMQIYKHQRPTIVTLGSSRSIPFHKEMFRGKFVNLSELIYKKNFQETPIIINELIKISKPRLIIMTLDFWWFVEAFTKNKKKYDNLESTNDISEKRNLSIRSIVQPLMWLYEGKMSVKQFLYYLFKIRMLNSDLNYGMQALSLENGYDQYGSYHHHSELIKGKEMRTNHLNAPPLNAKWVNFEGKYFTAAHTFNSNFLTTLTEIIDLCKQEHIKIVFILPPVSSKLLQLILKSGQLDYVEKLRHVLRESFQVYDFHNPESINAKENEFMDAYHTTNLVYFKILKKVLSQDGSLNKYINKEVIEEILTKESSYQYFLAGLTREDLKNWF